MDSSAILEKIAQRVAQSVSPTPAQAKAEKQFAKRLMAKLSKHLSGVKMHLVGSTARDTGLVGEQDIDVFCAFDRDLKEDFIVQKTVAACKKSFKTKWEMHYAEHPYLQARIEGYSVEVIPCYKTETGQKIQSAVDRTPLHMDFLQKQLTANQRQDVRALKRLLKTHGLYGAELRIRGFSGLLCEYLVLNYRSFSGLIDAARQWKPQVCIDMVHPAAPTTKGTRASSAPGSTPRHNAATNQPSSAASFDTPLVLIDAVDERRNVAAVVSQTQVHRFIGLCQALWQKPDEKSFFPQKQKAATATQLEKTLKTRGTDWTVLQMKKPYVVEDILWPQLERTAGSVQKQLELRDFSVIHAHAFEDEKNAYLFIELQHSTLPAVRRTKGPSAIHQQAVRQFAAGKKAWRGPYVEGERVWVEEKRPQANAWSVLEAMQKKPERFGIASHLQKPFKAAKRIDQVTRLPKTAVHPLTQFLTWKETWL